MNRRAKQLEDVSLQNKQGEQVLVWKAKIPLSEEEHRMLSERLRYEQEKSGVRIVLVPYLVDPEVTTAEQESPEGSQPKGTGENSDFSPPTDAEAKVKADDPPPADLPGADK